MVASPRYHRTVQGLEEISGPFSFWRKVMLRLSGNKTTAAATLNECLSAIPGQGFEHPV